MTTLEAVQQLLMNEYRLTREQVSPDARLDALGIDSLGMIEMLLQIEERFGITIPDESPPMPGTIRELVDFIEGLGASGPVSTEPVQTSPPPG